jgi:transposase
MTATAPTRTGCPSTRIGVGIDTSRYGHYAAFLREDLQPATAELAFAESADGYAQLRQRLELLAQRHPQAAFSIRLDIAGQYADNLPHFLHRLANGSLPPPTPLAGRDITLSCGDPQRNKNHRASFFAAKKSDAIEARACARLAVTERPASTAMVSPALRVLRQVAARLQATVRQRTRLVNQLHQLLALAFPELALLVKDISLGWVLELVHRYPTAALLANASADELAGIAYLPDANVAPLLGRARSSIASLSGPTIEGLVRDQVRQLRDVGARQQRLEGLLVTAYRALPRANHLDSIKGIGPVTAAVLTANIVGIDRFVTPGKLVAYFGTLPISMGSGIDREGQPRSSRRWVRSKRGNDLVRRYLWMAALSAVRYNPAVRALYRRVAAKHPDHKAIAIGHAMGKLLHLVFAVWKSGKPFDPAHHPWEAASGAASQGTAPAEQGQAQQSTGQTAGHNPELKPAVPVVTAACAHKVVETPPVGEGTFIDFAHLKAQLSMERLLGHLGLAQRLRGSGPQRRCACPIHRGDNRGRTFSVNLQDNVFTCFDARCGKKGDVIDLWAALHQLDVRAAAIDLIRTFDLEPTLWFVRLSRFWQRAAAGELWRSAR